LPPCSFLWIARSVRPRGELGQSDLHSPPVLH
jgi:hypothetical protein